MKCFHFSDTDRFLKEMRYYMVPAHRDFITWIENKSTVKELGRLAILHLDSFFQLYLKSLYMYKCSQFRKILGFIWQKFELE